MTYNIPYRNFASIYNDRNFMFILSLFCIYLALTPIYFFPSGLPQPADFFLFIGVIYGLLIYVASPQSKVRLVYIIILMFSAYTFLINAIHFYFLPDRKYLFSTIYYIFNISVFILISSLGRHNPDKFAKYAYIIIAATILFQIVAAAFAGFEFRRYVGTFNNPNQLANWALIAFCNLIILRYWSRFTYFDMFLILGLGYLIGLSLSKAGMICYMFLLAMLLFTKMFDRTKKLFIYALAYLLLVFALFQMMDTLLQGEFFQRTTVRLSEIGMEKDDSLVGRGYDRIWTHPEYIFLGAGEGGFARFTQSGAARELHSSIATILFSYGLLGSGIFFFFMYVFFRRLPRITWLLLFSILLFSLTHQNIRNTNFWVFLGLCSYLEASIRARRSQEEEAEFTYPPYSNQGVRSL